MSWYLVKIIYRIVCGDGDHTPQFDEQLRLVAATGEDDALVKGMHMAQDGSHAFYNDRKQLVKWQFIAISEMYCLQDWADGAELYSSVKEIDDAESYISLLKNKAASLYTTPVFYT